MDILKSFSELIAEVSTKLDGPMGLARQVAKDEEIRKRRIKFLKQFGVGPDKVVTASLVHGNNIGIVGASDAGTVVPSTDALITKEKGIYLSITVADCLPVFYFDPVHEIIALAHAGWRGVLAGIVGKVVLTMKDKFSSHPADILVGVGPHICGKHYEVQSDVTSQFDKYGSEVVVRRDGRVFLDLAQAVSVQLRNEGVAGQHIEISEECTFELIQKYFSYRRDNPENLETMLAFIGTRHD